MKSRYYNRQQTQVTFTGEGAPEGRTITSVLTWMDRITESSREMGWPRDIKCRVRTTTTEIVETVYHEEDGA